MSSLGEKIQAAAKDEEALKSILSKASSEDVASAVLSITKLPDASSVLNSALSALNSEALHPKQLQLVEACVAALKSDSMDAQIARDVTGVVLLQLAALPASSISQLTRQYVGAISRGEPLSGRWLDLLPRLLGTLAELADVEYDGVPQTGKEARADALAAVCRAQWSAPAAARLFEVLRDERLAAGELEQLLEAAGRLLARVGYQEVPPLAYQLVRLCPGAASGRLLQLLLAYFAAEEERVRRPDGDQRAAKSLRLAEGTVIYHVTHAPGLDAHLVREAVRHVRASAQCPARLLTPFSLALALALAGGEAHAQQALDGLVAALARVERERALRRDSCWLRAAAPAPVASEQLLLEAAERCAAGWAPAGDGLLRLAFALLAAAGQPLPRLGARTLTALVVRRPELAREAVARLVGCLAGGANVSAHVEALAQLVTGCPLAVADSRASLTDLLAHLGLLPPATAHRLLAALLPVLKICMPLKDHLVLTLRKLLVSKRCESRQTAVCGLLLCLRHFRVTGTLPFSQASQNFSCAMSQVAADLGPTFPTSANEALCLELLGVLRRCLTQQAVVRAALYAGLHEVVSRNPELAESVLGMLLQQLRLYVEPRAAAPPLLLAACMQVGADEVTLVEALPELMACLGACSRRVLAAAEPDDADEDGPETALAREAETVLDDIARRMMNTEPDDYDLGKESEVGGATVTGRRNAVVLHLLQGVLQALLDHRLQSPFEQDEAAAVAITCLYAKYTVVAELAAKKAVGKGKKKESEWKPVPAVSGRVRPPRDPSQDVLCLSLRSATRLLAALAADSAPGHAVALQRLRDAPALVRHAADAARQLTGQLHAEGECAGAEGGNSRHLTELGCRLAPALLRLAAAAADNDEPLAALCLEALGQLVAAFGRHFADRLPALLEAADAHGATGVVARCRLLLDAGAGARAAPPLIRLLLLAADEAPADQQAELLTWSQRLLQQTAGDEPQPSRQLVELALTLADRYSPHSALMRQLALAVHERLGDLDEDVELTGGEAPPAVVTEASGAACLLALCARLTGWLDAVDWLLVVCRADAAALLTEAAGAREAAVCGRLLALVAVLDELVQTAAPLGPASDAVLRVLGRAYVSLAALVKYYAARSKLGKLTRAVICNKLERVLEACGRRLTPHAYTFITFTESQQRRQRHAKSADPAGKRARVLRQTRLIPLLVCNVEQFEKHLIALARRTKLDLLAGVKLSTSRDFRINHATLQAALERSASSADEREPDEGDAPATAAAASAPAGRTQAEAAKAASVSQIVSRLSRPSQKTSKLSRSSQPPAKRARRGKR